MSEHDYSQKLFTISPVRSSEDLKDAVALFTAYAASLDVDLSYQDFAEEMAAMPGKYTCKNGGELLIARRMSTESREAIGCIALRGFSPATSTASSVPSSINTSQPQKQLCEMKRLYVSPNGRRMGLGRALAKAIIETAANKFGYHEMRLDTLPSMSAAQDIYKDLGFVDIEAYRFNPIEGTRYLSLDLTKYRAGHLGSD